MNEFKKTTSVIALLVPMVLGGFAYAGKDGETDTEPKSQTKSMMDPTAHAELTQAMKEMGNAMQTMMNLMSTTCVTCHAQKAVVYQTMGESWKKWHEEYNKKGEK